MDKPFIVALDFASKEEVRTFLQLFSDTSLFLKVGMELYFQEGPAMIDELKQHIEHVKTKEKQKAMAEFRALQAQINPHFIANTLSNVAWLAKMQRAENIETVVTSLIQLLNASMGRGNDIITIREEIQNIKSYISIQEFKFFKKIEVYFDLDSDIMDCKILRFILQPIVENSIIHGLGPKQGQGIISIKGYIDGDHLSINITDTGIGMEDWEFEKLLGGDVESKDRFNSLGLRNVNERIKLSYGDEYGLTVKSQKDMFTSVEIKLPVIV
ncbi:MAG: histidine kinase [Anoxybacillus ayderensis]|nr:histidine kinase [Anoxybacillus ayderensis]